jgi:dTDP-4-amino-4,6-dideoxygalactose transaminase
MQPYQGEPAYRALLLPHTEALCQRVLCFPNGTAMDDETIGRICALVTLILSDLPAVQERLAKT